MTRGAEQWPMSPTGLYADFEGSFGAIAQLLRSYIQARKRTATDSLDLSPDELLGLLRAELAKPVRQYRAYLDEARPNDADNIVAGSDGKGIILVDAAIRTLNARATAALKHGERGLAPADLQEIADSLDRLYELVTGSKENFRESLRA